MKGLLKRIVISALTVCLLCACLPVSAQAITVSIGENVVGTLDFDARTYTLSGTGPTYDFDSEPEIGQTTYNTVEIEAGVSYVGSFLFENARIGELILPDAPLTINEHAFDGSIIERVTFPQTATDASQYSVSTYSTGSFGSGVVYEADLGGLNGFPSGFRFENGDNYDLRTLIVGSNTESIPDNACNCFGTLESLTLPSGLLEIGVGAFECCEMLQSVRIPDGVTTISDYAFDYCIGLESVILPSHLASIGEWAFCNCGNLTSVTIPDGTTSIGVSAFEDCASLTDVSIPDSVTYIGINAFARTDVQHVHLPAGLQYIHQHSFGDSITYVCCDTEDCPVVREYAEKAEIEFRLCSGHSVVPRVAGDADGDGILSLKDAVLVRRYLADGWDVTIDEAAADVDGDGSVTLQDVVLVCRYLVGGWDVELL